MFRQIQILDPIQILNLNLNTNINIKINKTHPLKNLT
jgi:hypothetical protein